MIFDRDVAGLVGSLGTLLDLLINGGATILSIGFAVADVVLGSPELIVGIVSSLRAIAQIVPWLPRDALTDLLLIALAALVLIQLNRLIGKIQSQT